MIAHNTALTSASNTHTCMFGKHYPQPPLCFVCTMVLVVDTSHVQIRWYKTSNTTLVNPSLNA